MKKVLKTWTANLSPEEEKEFAIKLREASDVFERLSSILDQRVKSLVSKQISSNTYDSPSWAYIQADAIGYQRAIQEVLELIKER